MGNCFLDKENRAVYQHFSISSDDPISTGSQSVTTTFPIAVIRMVTPQKWLDFFGGVGP